MAKDAILFERDSEYEDWRKAHPHAFILNTPHAFTQVNSVIHKSDCEVLDRAARDTPAGRLAGGDYYKIGALSIEAARAWLYAKRATTSARLCSKCFEREIRDGGHDGSFGFEVGALYNRRDDLHGRFGGQAQGGMSTPKDAPVILLFTGDAGLEHGYRDDWHTDGYFHYVGEGQSGDMAWTGANLALRDHQATGKAVLIFRALGKGKPYRFMGRFELVDTYEREEIPDRDGNLRRVFVFRLKLIEGSIASPATEVDATDSGPFETTTSREVEVRTKQSLFRKRLAVVEDGCRVTGLCDLRFLTASHIKPWSACTTAQERVDGNNGLLLAPHIDHLFDRGWITFLDDGRLLLSPELPTFVRDVFGLAETRYPSGRPFNREQTRYLAFHRETVFRRSRNDPGLL